MCKWVFNQIIQMSGTFHFPINSNVHVYISWNWSSSDVHWVQDIRGTKKKLQIGKHCFEKVLHALSCKWPYADFMRSSQNETVMGWQQGHISTSQRKWAPQEAGKQSPLKQTDHKQLYSEYKHSGVSEVPFWQSVGNCQYVTFLDNIAYILQKKNKKES